MHSAISDTSDAAPPGADTETAVAPRAASAPGVPGLAALTALSAAALAACGGGSSSGGTGEAGGGAGTGGSGGSATQAPAGPATAAEAARFLQQAQFSSTEAEIADLRAKGYGAWLEEQMSRPIEGTGWDWLVEQGYGDLGVKFNGHYTDHMIWRELIAAPDALRKRVALAWSEILVVSTNGLDGYWPAFAMAAYWDLLNRHVFGNYRQLLEAITLNPAMGAYLNTRGNKKADGKGRQPDENYARELMQLFSIGLYELNPDGTLRGGAPKETYGPADVSQLARIFTGWQLDSSGRQHETDPAPFGRPMRLNAADHAPEPATFLGQTVGSGDGTARLKQALDVIFHHPNVGPFIGRQLIQRLVTSDPSPAYVGRVAAAFANNGAGVRGDLRAVTRAVLFDPEARQDAAQKGPAWGKLREPMLRFVQWARTFGAASADGRWIVWDLSDGASGLGQSPLRSPSVFNFFRPGYVPPGTALAASGQTAPEFQLANENSVAGYLNFMQGVIAWGYGAEASRIGVASYPRELALVDDPAALVERVNLLLAAGQLSAATKATIAGAIGAVRIWSDWERKVRVWSTIALVMASPEYLVQK